MKSLNTYIQEKLIINKNYNTVKYHPTTWNELRQIIEQRYEEQGPGTEENPIDFNDVDVSGMTTFYNSNSGGIFQYSKFEYIDVSDWDVSGVENMKQTFWACTKLKSIGDISNWDVSKVEYMNEMFCTCESLKELKISDWNVSSTETMCKMFMNCRKLESIGDISNWNVSRVKNMNSMFYACHELQTIGDISNWNVSNVNIKMFMFIGSGIKNIPGWYKK